MSEDRKNALSISAILVSQSAVVGNGGTLTIVGIYNRLTVTSLPAMVPTIALSVIVHGTRDQAGSEHEAEIHLLNKQRQPVAGTPVKVKFTFNANEPPEGLPARHILTAAINNFAVTEEGPFGFEIYIDDIYSGGTAFYVGAKS